MYELVAAVLWAAFSFTLVALLVGVVAQHHGRRRFALLLLFAAVAVLLAFSFIAGFTIGRFTALIPVLVCAYVVAMGRGPLAVAVSIVIGGLLYAACSWLFTPLIDSRGVWSILFGAWAIPFYTVLAIATFVVALIRPPATKAANPPPPPRPRPAVPG